MHNLETVSQIVKRHFEKLSEEDFDYLTCRFEDDKGYFLDDEDMRDIYADLLAKMNIQKFEFGASKLVIFFEDLLDYVVKIPFQGSIEAGWNYDDCVWELDPAALERINRLDGAGLEGKIPVYNRWDYCEVEAKIYELADEEEISDCFAGTFYLCDIWGYPVYVSEKIEKTWYYSSETKTIPKTRDSEEQAEAISNTREIDFSSLNMIAVLIEHYGYSKVDNLMRFISTYRIQDFHSENLGFDANGEVKLIDYSSYDC